MPSIGADVVASYVILSLSEVLGVMLLLDGVGVGAGISTGVRSGTTRTLNCLVSFLAPYLTSRGTKTLVHNTSCLKRNANVF